MTVINVKIRRLHEAAQIPAYATEGAAAFDLVAVEDTVIAPGETKKVPLGLAFEIPEGYEMQIRPRSGISERTPLRIPNAPATIDADFRGEVAVLIESTERWRSGMTTLLRRINGTFDRGADYVKSGTYIIRRGDRIAQAVIQPLPRVEFTESDELSETARGSGGFGSSGIGTEVST